MKSYHITPGSRELNGTLAQLSPELEVCTRIAGFQIIHHSFPLKLMELNLVHKMDKSWMMIKDRLKSKESQQGVKSFIDFATKDLGPHDEIRCPCVDCLNGTKHSPQVVRLHLIRRGIVCSYRTWVHHGKRVPLCHDYPSASNIDGERYGAAIFDIDDNLGELPTMLEKIYMSGLMDDHIDESPNSSKRENLVKFIRLFDDARRKVYPECEKFSVLSFVNKMLHIKVYNKWSNKSFNMVLQVLKEILPKCDETVPWTLYEAKKFLHELGLGYETIHAFKNDCILFWKDNAKQENCLTCKESRYKFNNQSGKKIPHKILRYFPLTSRLKHLYMSKKIAADMRWHKEKCVDDGVLRHPADGQTWKDFDMQYPKFSVEPRHVRLGLATDGFNPFGNMSTSYSMWPVLLMPYNLLPWKCMKEPYLMMSMLIPGPSSPGRGIDVYLQPLVEELKNLWEHGVQTYDATIGEIFTMHVAVMWTINDFPSYGTLSGWTTKGYLACPNCNMDASSQRLRSKIGYMGARWHLPENHIWRRSKLFNGQNVHRSKPWSYRENKYCSKLIRGHIGCMFRHNLDVMHIEKNICDNLVGTLLSIDGKNKDTDKAHLDLEDMRIRKELHLKRRSNGSFEKPPVSYILSPVERQGFCDFLKLIKYPDGYATNISSCLTAQGGKLTGLKTHDCHVLLQ
ncbi:uncharacterized protein LOC114279733 [Camellia sinensis]|uniref:uncharacterized protein LOC114279733 n=1 Tax=Camellia sinensis TaxID=4442 RepID=UPI001035F357|nr:uncharacterized protein LOC114279733 [Camellia sinensis]